MAELAKIAAVVRPDDKDNMCLGVALGGAGNRQKQFEKKCQLIKELHQRLDKVGDTAAELSLLAKCGWGMQGDPPPKSGRRRDDVAHLLTQAV